MIGIFKKKSKEEVLNKKYEKLMKESFKLSTSNRSASDQKFAEAQEIMRQIELLP